MGSREKSSRGSDSLRQNFSTAGHAYRFETEFEPRNQVTEMHKWAAVKSPLGAQTVLGDRHDPVCEISCKCRRPPAELARENFPTAGHANATDLKNVRARI